MKYGFTFAKLVQEKKVVNMSIMPEFSEHTNESYWHIDDDILYYNHDTKKFRCEVFEWSEEDEEWFEHDNKLSHVDCLHIALDYGIIYEKDE